MKFLTINDGLVLKLSTFLEPNDIMELMFANKDFLQKISGNAIIKNRLLVFELTHTINEIKVD